MAITREAVGDTRRPLPVAAAPALPPIGNRDYTRGDGVGGGMVQGRVYNLPALQDNHKATPGREGCCESLLAKLGGELSRQLESVAAGEQRVNGSGQGGGDGGDGGGGGGGGVVRLREEALLLRAEEASVLREIAERRDRVAALTDELCDAEDAVEEVG